MTAVLKELRKKNGSKSVKHLKRVVTGCNGEPIIKRLPMADAIQDMGDGNVYLLYNDHIGSTRAIPFTSKGVDTPHE